VSGSGTTADWDAAAELAPRTQLILAGGLDPDNVADAIRRVRPWGVDVCTGVETTPGSGHKDARKLRKFVEEARHAGDATSNATWAPAPETDPVAAPYDWMSDGA